MLGIALLHRRPDLEIAEPTEEVPSSSIEYLTRLSKDIP